jgi:hypothetical protein
MELAHVIEKADDFVGRHTDHLRRALAIWERYCAERSDEEQQDLRLTLHLTCQGKSQYHVSYVWSPGYQRGMLDLAASWNP